MNLAFAASFFVVVLGTQAPVGFTSAEPACQYAEAHPLGRLFGWVESNVMTCLAIDNGCELAEKARQAGGVPMVEMTCEWEEKTERKRMVRPK